MRSLLSLLAACTLSISIGSAAVACGTSTQTTTKIFEWSDIGKESFDSVDFFKYLLENPDTGTGQTLYKSIVDYISLSILKTDKNFKEKYEFAKIKINNQIQNIQDSLKAKFGRKWGQKWNEFLKDPQQGGNGITGSKQRYFDVLLKEESNSIVSKYYVGDNYYNYQYYSSNEISIWLSDIFNKLKEGSTLEQYKQNGIFKDKVWIVAKSVSSNKDTKQQEKELEEKILKANSASAIQLPFKVAKTENNKPLAPGHDYLIDPSNTIKGLLSNQQTKIAQLWLKNKAALWVRQIVIPFNANDKGNALKTEITPNLFKDKKNDINKIIKIIQTDGFESALKDQMQDIGSSTSSAETGDLGLVTLDSTNSNIKASFSAYTYTYLTSNQGIGSQKPEMPSFEIPEYTGSDYTSLVESINRKSNTTSEGHSSKYNDLVWMKDADSTSRYSGSDGINKLAMFIDEDGIHIVQTPGITYSSTVSQEPVQDIITNYNQLISNPEAAKNAKWEDVSKLSDRIGGLTNKPYLNYLQTQYLLWNTRHEKTFFDLNDSLNKFTSGSSDIASDIWWDYILFFNNNINNIHWNITEISGEEINASDKKINEFVTQMKTWFNTTSNNRWNKLQGNTNTDALIKNIKNLNNTWDEYGEDAPVARLDAEQIKIYLENVAGQTIWWYNPNSIKN